MPELPEVEIIKRGLSTNLKGAEIRNIWILTSASFQGKSELLQGKKILNCHRRAKILILELEGKSFILIHLKITGQLILLKVQEGKNPYSLASHSTRVILELQTNQGRYWLFFNDQRRFGWLKTVTGDIEPFFRHLGPEPLEPDFTWQILKNRLQKYPKRPVKSVLMDQTVIAGIGNIYASEACFLSKLDPRTKIYELADEHFQDLYQGIVQALQQGINLGGSSLRHYLNIQGEKGNFLEWAYVYNRNNQPCKICQTKIQKIKLGGRSTYFCPQCQKSPKLSLMEYVS